MKNRKLVLGIGNIYRHDDGIGPLVIQDLKKDNLPDVDLLDGGTDGLGVFEYLKEYKKAVVIDAANMGGAPGELKVFSSEDAKIKIKFDALSTHGFGLAEVLSLIEGLNVDIAITIVGVEPYDTSFGKGLSPDIQMNFNAIKKTVKDEIARI